MKHFLFLFFLLISFNGIAQQIDYNHQKGYVAGGYDVVSYFSNKAIKGNSKFKYRYDKASYRFSSKQNLDAFKSNPSKFLPQYGGWCAYAMADKGEKVSVNPKTFEIRNGKLYLFYNAFFDNTFESWLENTPSALVKKADANWRNIKYKS